MYSKYPYIKDNQFIFLKDVFIKIKKKFINKDVFTKKNLLSSLSK